MRRSQVRTNPMSQGRMVALGALTALGLALWYSSASSKAVVESKKAEIRKKVALDAAVKGALAAASPASVVPTTFVSSEPEPEVQVSVPPGATAANISELKRRGKIYLNAIVELTRLAGSADPRANIRSLRILRPKKDQTLFAPSGEPLHVSKSDRLVVVETLTGGKHYFLMTSLRPANWSVAEWNLSVYPIALGGQLVSPAGTVNLVNAPPIATPSVAIGIDEFTAMPNPSYLGNYF